MASVLTKFPLALISDAFISYIQWMFGNEEKVPEYYRWVADDRLSKIRISSPFVIDNQKPMSAPFIVVERSGFTFQHNIINDVKSGSENTFEQIEQVVILDGFINIICGSRVGSEASSLANFLAINLQADRHGIMDALKFLRNMNCVDIGPETPVVINTEVRRYEVVLRISASMQLGWLNVLREPELWNSVSIFAVNKESTTFSENGVVEKDKDILYDNSKSFGFEEGDDPRLNEKELSNKYYYIKFNENPQLYPIDSIEDKNTLKLLTHNEYNEPIPWAAPNNANDVKYELYWNCIHLTGEIPNNNQGE